MAQLLRDRGFQAWALAGGVRAWREAGLPMESKEAERMRDPRTICPECRSTMDRHGA